MDDLRLTKVPSSKTGMSIRRAVGDVFDAIVNPDITTKFWFTKSSGKLEVGKEVQWEWEMYGVSIKVTPKVVAPNERIAVEWPGPGGSTTVEWTFKVLENGTTFVAVSESGFTGSGDDIVKSVADSTEGFSLMLAGLKAFLEHDIRLNLVGDRFPKGI